MSGIVKGVEITWSAPATLILASVDDVIALSESLIVVVGSPFLIAIAVSPFGQIR